MGFGDTAKKLQMVADTAEKLYTRINELRDQVQTVRQKVDETAEQVDRIEGDVKSQRALLVALAEREGIDVERVLAESAIEEAEAEASEHEPAAGEQSDGKPTDDAGEGTMASDATTSGVATNDDGTAVTNAANDDE